MVPEYRSLANQSYSPALKAAVTNILCVLAVGFVILRFNGSFGWAVKKMHRLDPRNEVAANFPQEEL
jgi:hypothetical protein